MMHRQSGRMIELQILIAMAGIAIAVFIPQVMEGKGILTSLLTSAGWIALIFGGFAGLLFLLAIPDMIRDWRTTPAAVRAARRKNALEALQKIKSERLDVRAADPFGNTALHVALDSYEEERKRRAPEVVDFLLQRGADANAENTYRKTPLHLAVQHEYGLDTVRRLLAGGALPGDVLFDAAGKSGPDAVEVVKALVDAGARVTEPDVLGATPLHQAARYGAADMIRELLARGAEINARDNVGCTPLHAALWMPSLNAQRTARNVEALLAGGADRDATDRQDRTPRALAEESGVAEVIAAMKSTGS